MVDYRVEPIGFIRTCFPEKFGVPRQAQLVPAAKGQLILAPPFNDPACVEGLENCSHIWLNFIFHENIQQGWKPKVRPPRLGGNQKMGVFATRSSFRPNGLGLSVVALESIEVCDGKVCLHLAGVDLVDGTPVIDIKPYVPYSDAIHDAHNYFAESPPPSLAVIFSELATKKLDDHEALKTLIEQVLQQNPQPAYHAIDNKRDYKMALMNVTVVWRVVIQDGEPAIDVRDIIHQ